MERAKTGGPPRFAAGGGPARASAKTAERKPVASRFIGISYNHPTSDKGNREPPRRVKTNAGKIGRIRGRRMSMTGYWAGFARELTFLINIEPFLISVSE